MCGILGLICRSGGLDVGRLKNARDTMTHRGPDSAGIWRRHPELGWQVALGHRRLSILDLSAQSAQPLVLDSDGHVQPSRNDQLGGHMVLVFNGEIYNYIELRDELVALGQTIQSSGDVEVLLRAYAQWGPGCVARLNGMFAFAIWDERRRELFCARDRFGEKPFYYAFEPERGVFAFASEVKALIAAGIVDAELDQRAVYRYFRFAECAGSDQATWKGVRRLPPARTITIRFDATCLTAAVGQYWELESYPDRQISLASAADQFGELFRDSVRLRLRSDVPVGTSLSGGLDSSSVFCQVRSLGAAAGQRAFSARMEDPAMDEGKHILAVLASTNAVGYEVHPTASAFIQHLDSLCFHQEEPFSSTSVFASFMVQRLASESGVTVLLDGQGADEYLAGYAHYGAVVLVELARHARLLRWWIERKAYRRRSAVDPVPPRALLAFLLNRQSSDHGRLSVHDPRPVPFLREDVRHAFRDEQPMTIPSRQDALKTRLYADLMGGHLQELLRYADRNSMAFSRETRLPFLDHRLVEFAMSLPRDELWQGGESKRVLRRAMKGIVPDAILDRRDKIGFAAPSEAWWRGQSGTTLRQRLGAAEATLSDIVEPGIAQAGSADALSIITLASTLEQMRKLVSPAAVIRTA